jgi:WD40 repeat protein
MRLLSEGSGYLELMAYAPDGSHLVASARPGPAVHLWDLRAGTVQPLKEPRTPAPLAPPPEGFLSPLAFSRSGGLLAVGGDSQVSLRDNRTGLEKYILNAIGHQSRCLAFTPDEHTLVSAGIDPGNAGRHTAVVLWDVATTRRRKLPAPGVGDPLAIARDAALLLWCEPPMRDIPAHLTLWHVPGCRPLARRSLKALPTCAAFSPNGRQFTLAVDDLVLLFEIGHIVDYFGLALGANAWAPLTLPFWWKRLVSRLPPLGSPRVLEGHRERVLAVAYGPDGGTLFSAGLDSTVRCWDLPSQRERAAWSWPIGAVSSLAVAPDGMTAAAGGCLGRSVIWDLTWF